MNLISRPVSVPRVRVYDPNATVEYVLLSERDLPPDQQSVFTLKGLTAAQKGEIADSFTSMRRTSSGDQVVDVRTQAMMQRLVDYGLAGWRNVGAEFSLANDGALNPLDRRVADSVKDALGPYLEEIAGEIHRISGLNRGTAKNFGSQSEQRQEA